MNPFELYNVSVHLRNLADALVKDTGEIDEVIADEIERQNMKREELVESLALMIKESEAAADGIETEIKRLQNLKLRCLNRATSLCRIIERAVGPDEKFKTPLVSVSYRKSVSCFVPDQFDVKHLYPLGLARLIPERYEPDKNGIKALLKESGGTLQDANGYEIELKTNYSLQVK